MVGKWTVKRIGWRLDLVEKRMNIQMGGYDDLKGILASVKEGWSIGNHG
jgi:hypothetical protein